MRRIYFLAATLGLTACVPEASGPSRPFENDERPPPAASPPSAPPDVERPVVALRVSPAEVEIVEGAEVHLEALGRVEGLDAEVESTPEVAWQSSDPAVVVVEGPGHVRALGAGSARVRAILGRLVGEAVIEVRPAISEPVPTRVTIAPAAFTVDVADTTSVQAFVEFSDGTNDDVTEAASWSVADPTIATVTAGVVRGLSAGETEIRARSGDLEAVATVEVTRPPCTYPGTTSSPIRVGSTMPPLSWATARDASGQVVPLELEAIYCAPAASRPSIIIFVIGTGWCSACPSYIRTVNGLGDEIEAAGGLIVWVEAQDRSYRLASSAYADQYITNLVGRDHGLRIGDADSQPTPGSLYDAELLSVFPTAFVVRTSDMKIIVDQRSSNATLPYVRIAQSPSGDWSNPNAPPFQNNCGPTDEETFEPNDAAAQATTLAPGSFSGGICTDAPDFYRVDLTGRWQLDLAFSHQVGDLDVYVWDEARSRALERNGDKVGSDSATDNESFTHEGPALIRVHGYERASAPYQLTLTPR